MTIIISKDELRKSQNSVIEQLVQEHFLCNSATETSKGLRQFILDSHRMQFYFAGQPIPDYLKNMAATQKAAPDFAAQRLQRWVQRRLGSTFSAQFLAEYTQVPAYISIDVLTNYLLNIDLLLTPSAENSSIKVNIYVKEDRLCYDTVLENIHLQNGQSLPGSITIFCQYQENNGVGNFVLDKIRCSSTDLRKFILEDGAQHSMAPNPIDAAALAPKPTNAAAIANHTLHSRLTNHLLKTQNPIITQDKPTPPPEENIQQPLLAPQSEQEQARVKAAISDIKKVIGYYKSTCNLFGRNFLNYRLNIFNITKHKLALVNAIEKEISHWEKDLAAGKTIPLDQVKNLIINAATINGDIYKLQGPKAPFKKAPDFSQLLAQPQETNQRDLYSYHFQGKLGAQLEKVWESVKFNPDDIHSFFRAP